MKKLNKLVWMGVMMALPFAASADLSTEVKQALATNNTTIESSLTDISKNMAAIFAHRSLAPAATLGGGVFGAEIGLDVNDVDLDTAPLKKLVNAGGSQLESKYDISAIPVPTLSAAFGLPVLPLDFAVNYLPSVSGTSLMSAEVKYGVIEGGVALPAVSVSANYSTATLADTFDVTSYGADVSISKGFGVGVKFVPFAGVGYLSSNMSINDKAKPAATTIKTSYDSTATKLKVGAAIELGVFNLVGQWDKIGTYSAYSARVGLKF